MPMLNVGLVFWNMTTLFSPDIWDVILPIDEVIFFRGVSQPPTRYSLHPPRKILACKHEIPRNWPKEGWAIDIFDDDRLLDVDQAARWPQDPWNIVYTIWLFNIAMENNPFIDDFPINTSIYKGFSMAMLVITRWYMFILQLDLILWGFSDIFDCIPVIYRHLQSDPSSMWHFPSISM